MSDLERMNLTLAHRGADGSGMWCEESVGLSHRLLWTTPESLDEKLPLVSANGDYVITADARLDNRDELIAALGLMDRSSHGITDSALILAAYEKWGETSPERLLGDFVYVIWNKRQRGLFCARDHFGVRTFYYYYKPGKFFAFASEIKALLCLSQIPQRLNELHLGDYLEGIFEDKTSTFYQDILRLTPAHAATINDRGFHQRCYWSLDPSAELDLKTDADYAAAYRETFTAAVRCRMRSAFPIGSHLSGGLDSSSITCVARDIGGLKQNRKLKTFSVVFDDVPESDERPFIDAVVDEGGVEPQFIRGDVVTPLTDISRVLWHQDQPFHAPNLFLNWQVWSTVQRQGVRILLDGIMGDNVVSHGFAYLNELARSWRWVKLTREIRALAQQRRVSYWPILSRYLMNEGVKPAIPPSLKYLVRRVCGKPVSAEVLNCLIDRDFATKTGLTERVRFRDEAQKLRLRTSRQDHYQELMSGIIPAALEVVANGACAFNIELRIPFLDRRLAELCLAMPPEQKIHNGWTRAVARRALVGQLPPKIRLRSDKGNLGPNFIRGLLAEQVTFRKSVLKEQKNIQAYIRPNVVQGLYEKFFERKKASADEISCSY